MYERLTFPGLAEDKESKSHQKLFGYVRLNILYNPHLVRYTEITQQVVLFIQELGAKEIRKSTKLTFAENLRLNTV